MSLISIEKRRAFGSSLAKAGEELATCLGPGDRFGLAVTDAGDPSSNLGDPGLLDVAWPVAARRSEERLGEPLTLVSREGHRLLEHLLGSVGHAPHSTRWNANAATGSLGRDVDTNVDTPPPEAETADHAPRATGRNP